MAQQFTTAPTLPNLCTNQTLNNINLVKTMNNKQKDQTKKYHKIIQEIERIVDVQLQLQNITKLVEEANIQIAEIERMILQASHNYQIQTAGDIFSISEDLQNIIQSDMENQVYHIQQLLVDKLDNCKGKGNKYAKEHIKEIQDTYRQEDIVIKMSQNTNKGKQRVEEEVFLYKPYDVDEPRPKTFEPYFIQDKVNNLDKYIKYM